MGNENFHVGLEWTNETDQDEILTKLNRMSCLEFIPENFFDDRRMDFLSAVEKSGIPVLIHSVEISFGTMEPLKEEHFQRILEVAGRVNAVNFSDHLSMTEAGDVEIGQLTPIPWTIECADHVCRTIDQIQSRIPVPFLIENITNRFMIPETELTEVEFINRILSRTGCGLLIDLNNVHTNATNFGFDPFEWLDGIQLSQVRGVHLAGGYVDEDGTLIDSHSNWVQPRTWELYRYLCDRVIPEHTIVEWTIDPPSYDELLTEVDRAREIVAQAASRKLGRPFEHSAMATAAQGAR